MDGRNIVIHKPEDFAGMRAAGQLAAKTLDMIASYVKAGVTTGYLNDVIHDYTLDHGARPGPLNYRGFPKSCCISVNHVVCHGIPGDRVLHDGDILNIDVTPVLDGWYGDTSRMYIVGQAQRKALNLIRVAFECLEEGIAQVRPGNTLGDIGYAIQQYAHKSRYSVVRDFCGHGVGREFHEPPNVLHYGKPDEGVELIPGMFFTIEPMLNIGRPEVKILADNWTVVTRDRSLSAQFEHSLGVTENGCEIFTRSIVDTEKQSFV